MNLDGGRQRLSIRAFAAPSNGTCGVKIHSMKRNKPAGMPYRLAMKAAWLALVAPGLAAPAVPVSAQSRAVTMIDMAVGSDFEDYLRVLQVAGIAPLYPWSVRSFSVSEIPTLAAADSAGPWRLDRRFKASLIDVGAATLGSIYNSAYPFGSNDGAVWAGRGLTVAASGGVSGRYGPLSFTVAPIAFL